MSTKEGPGVPVEKQAGLHLYTLSTPNGKKIQIALEELREAYGTEFSWEIVDIFTNDQKEPWFLKMCGNGRIPSLTDNSRKPPVHVWESGAIFNYLSKYDKENKFHFTDEDEITQMNIWLFFQAAGVGPMQGQYNHFGRYAKEKLPYAIKRYHDETLRLYSVLDDQLSGKYTGEPKRDYLAGKGVGKYSWADMNMIGWVGGYATSGITDEEMKEYPSLVEWIERVKSRPAAVKGWNNYNKSLDLRSGSLSRSVEIRCE